MHLLAKFSSHMSYGYGDINPYISSDMNTLEKAQLTTLAHHIERFSKSRILIYNFKVWTRLAETREAGEDEQQRQLEWVMRVTQTQRGSHKALFFSSKHI